MIRPHRSDQRGFAIAVATLSLCLLAMPALAETGASTVAVRVGNHPGFGRIVFDLPAQADFNVTRDGQRITVSFGADAPIGAAPRVPRNVVSISNTPGRAEILLAPGATMHQARYGNHLVIDALDPTGGVVVTPTPAPPPPIQASPPAPLPAPPAPPAQRTEAPAPDGVTPPQPIAEASSAASTSPDADKPAPPSELIVSYDTPVGVAA